MKKTLITSILAVVLCVSMITGATYALFTSESETNIAVTSGKVNVEATVSKSNVEDWIYSPTLIAADGSAITDATNAADLATGTFANKGTAKLEGNKLTVENITPGDEVNLVVNVVNKSNVAIKYRTTITSATGDSDLIKAMVITVDQEAYTGAEVKSTWMNADPVADTEAGVTLDTFLVSIRLPESVKGDQYEGKSLAFSFAVEAVQANADTTEDVTADTAATLTELAALINEFCSNAEDEFATIQLTESFAATPEESWTELCNGITYAGAKKLVIDGGGHSITGLDAPLVTGFRGGSALTVKNLTLNESQVVKNSYNGMGVGAFLGYADVSGEIVFNECKLINSNIVCTDDASAGGFLGNTYATNVGFYDCSVENTKVKSVSNAGGLIGLSGSNTIIERTTINNVTVESTEKGAWRVGLLAGTFNVETATVTISDTTLLGANTVSQPDAGPTSIKDNRNGAITKLYGRNYKTVVIDNVSYDACHQ